MRLRGLGVIRDAVLEFGPGLTVVTGETGAGKTMVVTGLGLLMGGRADPGAVREGMPSAVVEAVLDDITRRARERAQEAELLRLGLAEIERVDPQPGEDTALRAEATRLAHAEELQQAAQTAHLALSGDPDASDGAGDVGALLATARRALDQVRGHDPQLAALADRLAEVGYLVADVAAEAASYAGSVESDPIRLAAIEDRRAVLTTLTRAYAEDVDGVLAWAKDAAGRLTELEGDDDRIVELGLERDRLRVRLAASGAA